MLGFWWAVVFGALRRARVVTTLLIISCAPIRTEPPRVATASSVARPAPAPPPPVPVPLDPAVRSGKLPNGLGYCVMHRAYPSGRAALWLAVNAGSVLEDDDQRGLAHLVEHMAFNGTAHYPKQALLDFIQSVGMQLGPDVNAFTGVDQTVYEFTLPTDRPELLEQGLDVLHEIAHDVTFDPAEVELERPVVLEEWRLRRGVRARAADERDPVLYAGSRYAERDPIGLPTRFARRLLQRSNVFMTIGIGPI